MYVCGKPGLTLTGLNRKQRSYPGAGQGRLARISREQETRLLDRSPADPSLQNPQFPGWQTPPGSRPLTQHQDHLATQTVVDVEGLLTVVVLLPIPGVRADYRAGHYFRHGSEEQQGTTSQRGGGGNPGSCANDVIDVPRAFSQPEGWSRVRSSRVDFRVVPFSQDAEGEPP